MSDEEAPAEPGTAAEAARRAYDALIRHNRDLADAADRAYSAAQAAATYWRGMPAWHRQLMPLELRRVMDALASAMGDAR